MQYIPVDTWRNNNAIMTSNYVATSFWRNNDVIITSCAHRDLAFGSGLHVSRAVCSGHCNQLVLYFKMFGGHSRSYSKYLVHNSMLKWIANGFQKCL